MYEFCLQHQAASRKIIIQLELRVDTIFKYLPLYLIKLSSKNPNNVLKLEFVTGTYLITKYLVQSAVVITYSSYSIALKALF